MTNSDCPKCRGRMEEGWMVDQGYGAIHQPSFVPGKPDKKWWGIKVNKKAMVKIVTMRCTRCGFLENYAKG